MTKNLEALLKKYKGAVQLASEERPKTRISLGPLSLNLAVGHPLGVQAGRIVQIAGRYSSGKSTLALDIVAQYQKSLNIPAAYVDFERAFDKDYAHNIGVDLSNLHMVRTDSVEEGLNIVESLIKTNEVKLIVIDSIAAAKPASENEKDYDDAQKMANSAAVITRFCYRVIPLLDNHDVLLLVLNQLRSNFNTMSPEKEIPFGAKALGYNTSVLIQTVAVSNGEDESEIQATIKKNRTGPPRRAIRFNINYGIGIDHDKDIIDLAVEHGLVEKSGSSWWKYNGVSLQGMDKAKTQFPIDELRAKIIEMETT